MHQIRLKSSESPTFKRGILWHILASILIFVILSYLIRTSDYFAFSAFLVAFLMYFYFNYQTKLKTSKIVISERDICINKNAYPIESFRSFYLFKGSNKRPPMLILRGGGMSHSITLPENKKSKVENLIRKKIKKLRKPLFLDRLCYWLKI